MLASDAYRMEWNKPHPCEQLVALCGRPHRSLAGSPLTMIPVSYFSEADTYRQPKAEIRASCSCATMLDQIWIPAVFGKTVAQRVKLEMT